ncbi:hypothetical protein [Actinomadura bangladeshensis]|uniref:Sugar ABC transporter ATP-binding protein n=1 Tax=Actinomadura bangladeshensis TaxID=453573 RepID=A0A4R4P772_9ACTN|nr:hypothetical protein [Actinomadura bangladeshensis]TDC17614.1 hypothetical protein E1284_08535 [Actinomadura bangladeshensis]
MHGTELQAGHGPQAARDAGIAFVHQDLGLVEDLSVVDNIALHIGFQRRRGLIDGRSTSAVVARVLAELRDGCRFPALSGAAEDG